MAKSLVFAQTTSSQKSRVEEHIQEISKYIKNTSSGDFPSFSKSGAILSMGLLTLGGNNCTVSMLSDNGHKSLFGGDNGNIIRPVAVAGVLLFMQSWHWYPFNHFLSLAVKPTAFIGITSALKMPKHFRLFCRNAQNYEFPEFKLEEEKKKTEASEVTLSISEKSKLERYRRRSKNKKSGLLQKSSAIASTKKLGDDTVASSKAVPSPGAVSSTGEETTASSSNAKPSTDAVSSTREEAMKKNGIASADKKDEKEKSKEEETALKVEKALKNCVLKNPCRITIKQRKEVGEFVQQRYRTIKKGFGVILLKDNCPKDPEDLATNKYIHGKNM
ncbi:hypothetical protein MHBO_003797 [Bonamia ostreae]|uniref:26S proteasome regulatory subunit RPN2 C-terminal domain-containing protein n=1 Tax=Bonamia ostreae TaxID=126728 RepID=A0ABV2ARL4_9EUKA